MGDLVGDSRVKRKRLLVVPFIRLQSGLDTYKDVHPHEVLGGKNTTGDNLLPFALAKRIRK